MLVLWLKEVCAILFPGENSTVCVCVGGLTLLLSVTPSTGWGPQNRSYVQESFSGE